MGIGLDTAGTSAGGNASFSASKESRSADKSGVSELYLVSRLKMYDLTYSEIDESTVSIIRYIIDNIETSDIFPFCRNNSVKSYTDLSPLFASVLDIYNNKSMPADYVDDDFLEEPGIRKIEVTKI